MASPSSSLTVSSTRIFVGTCKSLTIHFSTTVCWTSFCPKYTSSGWTILKSFIQTVATPRKKWGRVTPSRRLDSGATVANAPFCSSCCRGMPEGYISGTEGTKRASILPFEEDSGEDNSVFRASSCSMSVVRVRGYRERSSCGANCAGLTNTLITRLSWVWAAERIREMCPACRPIVGIMATLLRWFACWRRHCRIEAMEV